MPTEIILPKVDMDMATGRISRWYVEEGGEIRKGEVLFEIETDKAAMEIDAPVSGTVREITGKEGVDIAVGARVAMIFEAGEAYKATAAAAPAASGVPSSAAEIAAPVEAALADLSTVKAGEGSDVRATPLARRLCREKGIDIAAIAGTGPHGRVRRCDIEAYDQSQAEDAAMPAAAGALSPPAAPAAPAAQAAASPASSEATRKLFAEGSYDVVPHDSMRRTIARRLVEAKGTVPHFYLKISCEIDALLALRAKLNSSAPNGAGGPAFKLSVNDMVIKAMAMALRDVPDANVSWTDDGMLKHAHVDVGVAVSIPGGLITPIVRKAETKSISAISNEMKDLAERARARKLKPEEYQGGTTAISNLGMFGVEEFAAIINPPHASILAVGVGEKRAVVKGDVLVPATMMTVTLSTDHRAVDGALAAQLIAAFRTYVENPYLLLA